MLSTMRVERRERSMCWQCKSLVGKSCLRVYLVEMLSGAGPENGMFLTSCARDTMRVLCDHQMWNNIKMSLNLHTLLVGEWESIEAWRVAVTCFACLIRQALMLLRNIAVRILMKRPRKRFANFGDPPESFVDSGQNTLGWLFPHHHTDNRSTVHVRK